MTGAARTSLMDMVRGSDATAVSPIAVVDTTLVYEVVSRVGSQASPLGYVVVRRRLMEAGADASAPLRAVVGSDASILLGNARGDVWTDMVRRVPMPPAARAASAVVEYDEPRLGPVFASTHAIANTPWNLVIEFPRATVLHEVQAGMLAIILFGLAALLIAAVMSWRLSGEFTRPLEELATAAERISGGDYDRPLAVRGRRRDRRRGERVQPNGVELARQPGGARGEGRRGRVVGAPSRARDHIERRRPVRARAARRRDAVHLDQRERSRTFSATVSPKRSRRDGGRATSTPTI